MESRHKILGNLSNEDVFASLKACFLADKQDYTEEEAYRFCECRALISQGKTYDEVADLFRERGLTVPEQLQPNFPEVLPKNKQRKNNDQPTTEAASEPTSQPVSELKSIPELLQLASFETGKNISLAQAINILQVCGLSENSLHYSLQECDRFLSACRLLWSLD